MPFPFQIISVFTAPKLGYAGNPSAVVLLEEALPEMELQAVASDLNQPATTFLWPRDDARQFGVRWFAPDGEIDLCGHGTAAAMAFLKQHYQQSEAELHYGKNGRLRGGVTDDQVWFYVQPFAIIARQDPPEGLEEALGVPLLEYLTTPGKNLVVVESEAALAAMRPDFSALARLEPFAYAVTAPGDEVDFVSRTLVPKVQQLEDHATGSSHAALAPFWSERFRKNKLTARQLSRRGGQFHCTIGHTKILLSGTYRRVAQGELHWP